MTKDKCKVTLVFDSVEERTEWLNKIAHSDKSISKEMGEIKNHNVENIVVGIKGEEDQNDDRQLSLPFGKMPNCS
jgi:hypothetical protein